MGEASQFERTMRRAGTNDMDRELMAAGWKRVRLGLYRAPCGCLFRGPARAWTEMNGTHLADHIASGLPPNGSC